MPCYSTPIVGVMHWPHLDYGSLGVEKMFGGFDLVASAPEGVAVSVGYNQRDITDRTAAYTIEGDTINAQSVPIPVSGPSFDLKLTFEPDQAWEWYAANIYIQENRVR